MSDLLFVFGCVDLDTSPQSKLWGRSTIDPHIASLGSSDLVLTSGDFGPAKWASESALVLGKRIVELRADGYRYINNRQSDLWRTSSSAHVQDDKLIEACIKSRAAGWNVKIVSLSSESMTTKTKYILYRAEKSEFQVSRNLYVPMAASTSTLPPVLWTDTETSGTSNNDRIIEIAAIHTDPSSKIILSTFHRRIALLPGVRIPDYIAQINHYSESLWAGAPSAREAMRDFVAWAPPAFVLAGYNISFDKRYILAELNRHGIQPPKITGVIDTMQTARKILKKRGLIGSARLSEVCGYFGISNADAHGAMPDAEMARAVYLKFMNINGSDSGEIPT